MAIHLSGLPGSGVPKDTGRAVHPPVRPCSGWGLPSRPGHPGRWCALTAPFHPYLCATRGCAIGGLFSVALSCRSPRLAVSQHPALWSPDLPRPGPPEGSPPPGWAAATRPAHRPVHRPTPWDGPAPTPSGVAGPIPSRRASNLATCRSNHAPNASWSTRPVPTHCPSPSSTDGSTGPSGPPSPRNSGSPGRSARSRSFPGAIALLTWWTPPTPGTAGRPLSTSSAGRPRGGASAPPSTAWASSSMPAWWFGPGGKSSSTRPAAPSTSSFPSLTPMPSWARWPPSGPD